MSKANDTDFVQTTDRAFWYGAQERVARSVEQRGYYSGWTDEELVNRHAAKLLEETVECAEEAWLPWWVRLSARLTGALARRAFDRRRVWERTRPKNSEAHARFQKELADVQVVLLSAASIPNVGHLPFNVIAAAVAKADADRARGVRGQEKKEEQSHVSSSV